MKNVLSNLNINIHIFYIKLNQPQIFIKREENYTTFFCFGYQAYAAQSPFLYTRGAYFINALRKANVFTDLTSNSPAENCIEIRNRVLEGINRLNVPALLSVILRKKEKKK
ncbi:hypothetical protein COEREDRAFT_81707 [Coemansia reversa NRRL 1564]|uniref:Uncharacterized protein n=1 Tax=Coemansia reversa (strain ATCC 12441 / NRRL 1564) TaxID=763665 RepID=A0A2G5B9U6_COERN|nr:hypothetical protein COEREDRAFT_81707 [Coemansia reversa NRRL 1564]|eukprot:PIA15760.1 hypothetical protein COEREDRAFT_81707 [Coemansia reversa NRRL 1564]